MKLKYHYRRQAFTLIELVVVMVIIGILAGMALPKFQKIIWRGRYAEVYSIVGSLANAEDAYFLEHQSYTLTSTQAQSRCGNGVPDGSTEVQVALGRTISSKCYFQYLVYPTSAYPAATNIYFRRPPYSWAWVYNYVTRTWFVYGSGDGGPARDYFVVPAQ